MPNFRNLSILFVLILIVAVGGWFWVTAGQEAKLSVAATTGPNPEIIKPDAPLLPTVNVQRPIGWKQGAKPTAGHGLVVNRFAQGLDHPRTLYTMPNGDVLVTLTAAPPKSFSGGGLGGIITRFFLKRAGSGVKSPNKLVLLRDSNGDGVANQRFVLLTNLDSPSGIAWRDGTLYIADHNALLSYPYKVGQTTITAKPTKLLDLPPAGQHWMRNLEFGPQGKELYIAIGSATNIGEDGMQAEQGRADIWQYDLASKTKRIWGAGMRNPNGMSWNPWSGELWTVVDERDRLGPDLVPDFLSNVPLGVVYGWPWVYYKDHIDDRVTSPMPQFLTDYTRYPEYALGAHTTPLGLIFTKAGTKMGEQFDHGAFIARHGSWNRKPADGYDVIYVPFDSRGNPDGKPREVLTGFLDGHGHTHGRPTWVAWDKTGGLLVSDDTAGIIWRVINPAAKATPPPKLNTGPPLPPQRELHGNPADAFVNPPKDIRIPMPGGK